MRLSSRKLQRTKQVDLPMTPMIDVVFQLLIFFMLTSAFVRTERNLDSTIRMKGKSASQAASDLEPAIVDVVRSGGRFVYRLGGRELTTEGELQQLLRSFSNKLDGAFVRVSDEAPFRMAAAAVQACKSASFGTVSYVPLPPE